MTAWEKQVGGGHYKDFQIQPAEFIQANEIRWLEGNVIKYVCRHRQKNGRQDLEKARHYLEMLMEREYPAKYDTEHELARSLDMGRRLDRL